MLTEKWSQKERDAAKRQLWPFGDPSKWRNYSLGPSDALDLACQRNALRTALEECRVVLITDNEYPEDSGSIIAIDKVLTKSK